MAGLRWPHWRNIGRTVIEIDVRGCMAENHVLKRVGVITDIGDQRRLLGNPKAESMLRLKCRVFESREDLPAEYFYPLTDGALQPSEIDSDVLYWRH